MAEIVSLCVRGFAAASAVCVADISLLSWVGVVSPDGTGVEVAALNGFCLNFGT